MERPLLSIDRFTRLLEEAASELPQEIFKGLNLGIGVVEDCRVNPNAPSGVPVYTLGEYRASRSMGRGIVLFYGSFLRVYPGLRDDAQAKAHIMAVLKHELTHHLESLAGSNDLAIEDAKRLLEM